MRLEYFEMIDQIEALNMDETSIIVNASVPSKSTVFEGHFPGQPLMPGVLLIEAMAQASGYLILALNGFRQMPFLASVKEAKFRSFVLPGSELTVEASREHDGSGYAVTRANVQQDGKKVCEAQLTFRIVAFPAPEVEEYVRQRAHDTGLVNVG